MRGSNRIWNPFFVSLRERNIGQTGPELYPLLPAMKELITTTAEEREKGLRRFWIVAKAQGFEREKLLVLAPTWGTRLPGMVVVALGEFENLAEKYARNTPRFWMWTPYQQPFRRSDAFKR